jgi:hypothetical protein
LGGIPHGIGIAFTIGHFERDEAGRVEAVGRGEQGLSEESPVAERLQGGGEEEEELEQGLGL